jgi:hypothetical protein
MALHQNFPGSPYEVLDPTVTVLGLNRTWVHEIDPQIMKRDNDPWLS